MNQVKIIALSFLFVVAAGANDAPEFSNMFDEFTYRFQEALEHESDLYEIRLTTFGVLEMQIFSMIFPHVFWDDEARYFTEGAIAHVEQFEIEIQNLEVSYLNSLDTTRYNQVARHSKEVFTSINPLNSAEIVWLDNFEAHPASGPRQKNVVETPKVEGGPRTLDLRSPTQASEYYRYIAEATSSDAYERAENLIRRVLVWAKAQKLKGMEVEFDLFKALLDGAKSLPSDFELRQAIDKVFMMPVADCAGILSQEKK